MGGAFDLLETMRWTPDGGFFLLDRHLSRLSASARHFGYPCDATRVRGEIDRAVAASAKPLRVRLLLSHDGTPRVEYAPLEPTTAPARVILARAPVDPAAVFLYHKTTNRRVYDEAKRVEPGDGFDDVVLWNPDRQVTESTIANLVAEIDGRKVTPPVECGLLAGTFRARLLEDGEIEEGIVTVDQLRAAPRMWLINSVREWWPARIVSQTTTAMASAPTSASATAPQTTNPSQR